MQERINKENVMILKKYFHNVVSLGVIGKKEEEGLRKLLTALLEIVKNSKKFIFFYFFIFILFLLFLLFNLFSNQKKKKTGKNKPKSSPSQLTPPEQ